MNPLPPTDERAVIAYLRTSSAEQGKAYGPDVQRAAVRAFAKREGLTIAAEHHEDISGTTTIDQRAGMQAAIVSAYRHGASAVVVAERSRLARDEYVAHDALRALAGVGLRVLYADGSNGEDDSALLMDGIGHVIAAHDRRRIVARLKAGREAKATRHPGSRAQGGKVPYGYARTADGLAIDPEQAAHVRRIFELVRSGRSMQAAADAMAAETGRSWHPATVSGIVRRRVYIEQPGRIIDPRVWHAAQAAVSARRKRPALST